MQLPGEFGRLIALYFDQPRIGGGKLHNIFSDKGSLVKSDLLALSENSYTP